MTHKRNDRSPSYPFPGGRTVTRIVTTPLTECYIVHGRITPNGIHVPVPIYTPRKGKRVSFPRKQRVEKVQTNCSWFEKSSKNGIKVKLTISMYLTTIKFPRGRTTATAMENFPLLFSACTSRRGALLLIAHWLL